MAKKTGKPARGRGNGQGTVRQLPSGRYQFTLTFGYTAEGRRIEKSGTFATKTQAEAELAKARADRDRGLSVSVDNITLSEYAARYLERRGDLDAKSQLIYKLEIGYALEILGKMRVQDIKPHHLKDAVSALRSKVMGAGRTAGSPMSGRTLGKVAMHLRRLFREAVEDKIVQVNPAESLKITKTRSSTPHSSETVGKVLNRNDLTRFVQIGNALHAAGGCPLWPAVFTAVSLGLRRGEVMGLNWDEIDLERGMLYVRYSLTCVSGEVRRGKPKTSESVRDLYIPTSLKTILEQHKNSLGEQRTRAREAWTESGAVFASEVGTYTRPERLQDALDKVLNVSNPDLLEGILKRLKHAPVAALEHLRLCVSAGEALPHISPHDLRHTYATTALMHGVPVEVVSKILGHARVSITLDIYRHVLDTERRKAAVDLFEEATPLPSSSNHNHALKLN